MTTERETPSEVETGWKWQIERSIRAPGDLPAAFFEDAASLEGAKEACDRFPMCATPYYLSLANPEDPRDPIRIMAVPDGAELEVGPGEEEDPIGEEEHSPIPGIVRRYPDRALLIVSGACPVYCRHCTRRILPRRKLAVLDREGVSRACEYLGDNPEIRDVIVSGGDPLLLEDEEIDRVLGAIRRVPSVEILRVATRAPVTLPMRVTEGLARVLSSHGPLYVCTQFNHPREVTSEAAAAAALLADAGIPLANQAVLLRGVNDSAKVQEDLCRALLRARVRPYYLFVCDPVSGTGHLRTPISAGIEIMAHLRGRLGGLGIPQLVVDLPGGHGKVPLLPGYAVERRDGAVVFEAPDGALVEYPDPPSGSK